MNLKMYSLTRLKKYGLLLVGIKWHTTKKLNLIDLDSKVGYHYYVKVLCFSLFSTDVRLLGGRRTFYSENDDGLSFYKSKSF